MLAVLYEEGTLHAINLEEEVEELIGRPSELPFDRLLSFLEWQGLIERRKEQTWRLTMKGEQILRVQHDSFHTCVDPARVERDGPGSRPRGEEK